MYYSAFHHTHLSIFRENKLFKKNITMDNGNNNINLIAMAIDFIPTEDNTTASFAVDPARFGFDPDTSLSTGYSTSEVDLPKTRSFAPPALIMLLRLHMLLNNKYRTSARAGSARYYSLL
jgi:hypothetical protein